MLVAFDKNGKPVAALFAVIIRKNRFLRGSIFKRALILQKPSFFEENISQIEVFEILISHLVQETKKRVFLIRYENLSSTVFGYRAFRKNRFFSTKWINVKNSLQRKRNVWDQLSATRKNQVNKASKKGVLLEELTSEEDLHEIYKLIEETNHKKISHRFPPYKYFENFFQHYVLNDKGKILLARYRNKIIGGAILGFENSTTAFCLYYWGKTQRYKALYPTIFTIYSAMKMAEDEGFQYFDFMDVGFINKKSGRLRFLLQFGGKQKATRCWYRYNWGLLNFFANKYYN